MKSALEGLRIVDFTRFQAGPSATVLLADMGAEVIKVESARRHDAMRLMTSDLPGDSPLVSGGLFSVFNRGKKSITLDVSLPKGLELVKRLISLSDVVVDNFAPGVMARLGLGYRALREIKPDIIVVSLSGFGATGPYKDYVAFAKPVHAYAGLTELTGYTDGPPAEPGAALGDNFLGTYAAFAIMAALYHRARTGEGQFVDVTMAESVLCALPEAVMAYTMNQTMPSHMGNRDEIMTPHNVYRCRGEDEWVAIAISNDEEWAALCRVIGKPNLKLDRWKNQDKIDRLVEEWTLNHSKYEAMEILQKAGIAASPVLNVKDLTSDPHLKERDYFVEADYPASGKWLAGPSWKMSDTPGGISRRHAPVEGEDNEYVFGQLLGLNKFEIAQLITERVIY